MTFLLSGTKSKDWSRRTELPDPGRLGAGQVVAADAGREGGRAPRSRSLEKSRLPGPSGNHEPGSLVQADLRRKQGREKEVVRHMQVPVVVVNGAERSKAERQRGRFQVISPFGGLILRESQGSRSREASRELAPRGRTPSV